MGGISVIGRCAQPKHCRHVPHGYTRRRAELVYLPVKLVTAAVDGREFVLTQWVYPRKGTSMARPSVIRGMVVALLLPAICIVLWMWPASPGTEKVEPVYRGQRASFW